MHPCNLWLLGHFPLSTHTLVLDSLFNIHFCSFYSFLPFLTLLVLRSFFVTNPFSYLNLAFRERSTLFPAPGNLTSLYFLTWLSFDFNFSTLHRTLRKRQTTVHQQTPADSSLDSAPPTRTSLVAFGLPAGRQPHLLSLQSTYHHLYCTVYVNKSKYKSQIKFLKAINWEFTWETEK